MLKLTGNYGTVYASYVGVDFVAATLTGQTEICINGRVHFVTESPEDVLAMIEAAWAKDETSHVCPDCQEIERSAQH